MSEIFKSISEHLPYFGYEMKYEDGYLKTVTAPPYRPYFWVIPNWGGVTFRALFPVGPAATNDRNAFLQWVNSANEIASITRFIALDQYLAVEAWFPPPYHREAFAIFFERYISDIGAPSTKDADAVAKFFPS